MSSSNRFKKNIHNSKVQYAKTGSAEEKMLNDAALSTPLRHPPFDEDTRGKLRHLQATFADVYPNTFTQWEDGFRRDTNPKVEIDHWLKMADAYTAQTQDKELSLAEKKHIFAEIIQGVNEANPIVVSKGKPDTAAPMND